MNRIEATRVEPQREIQPAQNLSKPANVAPDTGGFVNPDAATAAQERLGISNNLQNSLLQRVLNLADNGNVGGKPANPPAPAYPNAPLYSEGTGDGNPIHYNDVKQGTYNDCFLMASIAAVAKNNPDAIKNMITENRDAYGNVTSYTVTLHQKDGGFLGTGLFSDGYEQRQIEVLPHEITTNGAHPGDNSELWVKVIEAAYAKTIGGTSVYENGGSPANALPALTGRDATSHSVGGSYSFEQLQQDVAGGKNVVVNSKTKEHFKAADGNEYGLYNWHVYVVDRVYTDADGRKMVQLHNPWGSDHPKPIPFEEMSTYFNQFTLN